MNTYWKLEHNFKYNTDVWDVGINGRQDEIDVHIKQFGA